MEHSMLRILAPVRILFFRRLLTHLASKIYSTKEKVQTTVPLGRTKKKYIKN